MAIFVELSPAVGVGAVVVPVNTGSVNIIALLSLVTLPRPIIVDVIPDTVPVNVGLSIGALVAIKSVTVVAKAESSARALANSFSVSRLSGALSTRAETSVRTNAVVAICVVLVPCAAVGAVGVPVRLLGMTKSNIWLGANPVMEAAAVAP